MSGVAVKKPRGKIPLKVKISDFKGKGAQTIFDNVKKSNVTIVEKDGKPTSVIISFERYKEYDKLFQEELEDARDIKLAQERMKKYDPSRIISREEFMKRIGITQADVDACGDIELE